VEELIPYILLLITWNPQQPGQFDVERRNVVFATPEACNAAGDDMVIRFDMYNEDKKRKSFTYRCIRSASGSEADALHEELELAKAEKAKRDKEEPK
jgi:hypothetical protein